MKKKQKPKLGDTLSTYVGNVVLRVKTFVLDMSPIHRYHVVAEDTYVRGDVHPVSSCLVVRRKAWGTPEEGVIISRFLGETNVTRRTPVTLPRVRRSSAMVDKARLSS